jgi:DNA-binding phage protein
MQNPSTQAIAAKFAILSPLLDERARRLWAAAEARAIGRGGISQVAEATGLSRATIRAGWQELARPVSAPELQPPVVTVQVVVTEITPQLALAERVWGAEKEPLYPGEPLHRRR